MTTKQIRNRCRSPRAGVSNQSTSTGAGPSAINRLQSNLQLAVCYVDPASLKSPRRGLRKHSDRQVNQMAASIRAFGFLNPILIDGEGRIICGHGRWLAAKEIGCDTVPVICVEHLTEEQMRLYAIAENKLAELSEWDTGELKLELTELTDLSLDLALDLNLELTGFTTSEIDDIVIAADEDSDGDGVGGGTEPPEHPVTRAGDCWQLGDHRLLCGNALEEESYVALMGAERAQMVFCDPPYNLSAKSISGLGEVQHDDFAMASGEMTRPEFTTFLTTSFSHMANYSEDGSIHFQCMDWRHMREMQDAGEAVYSELKNLIVWDKGTGGMGTFYRSQHELIFAWKKGKAKHINNFGLGDTGRYRTNVWACRGNNSFHKDRGKQLASHATVKPVALIADAIRDCSKPGGIVLDGFGGSGSTLLAAEHTGRRARLIELEPRYCDVTIRRWEEQTGREAVLVATGQTFAELAGERGIDLDGALETDNDTVESGEDA